jgi:hypothetical protein
MERKSIAAVDVYDRNMTMDICHMTGHGKKLLHMTGHGKRCHTYVLCIPSIELNILSIELSIDIPGI